MAALFGGAPRTGGGPPRPAPGGVRRSWGRSWGRSWARSWSRSWSWPLSLAWGLVLGLVAGLALALLWEHPWSLAPWAGLLIGLGWAGWDVRPRQAGDPGLRPPPAPPPARLVQDGPFPMVELAGGTFFMGSPAGDRMARPDERPRRRVRVGPLRICRTPVTRAQWDAAMGTNGRRDWGPGGDDHPATAITWEDALDLCNALSDRQGYRRCYRRGWVWPWRGWVCDWGADGYRLPTEAEWEFACRAGSETAWSWGDDQRACDLYAWHAGNAGGHTHPVGGKRPNPWGLYDMHGNVWEWCWDWYGPYGSGAATDPRGPSRGRRRVLRGGSFFNPPVFLRSAFRGDVEPENRHRISGLRCVRVPARQH